MIINANALKIPLADKSVHCIVTSPPYWGLRDYGTAKWEGGEPGCDHNPQRPDGGDRSDRTLPLGRGGMYRSICGKCGAIRIDNQLGLERTPEEYVAAMVAVFRECWRVLRDDGTLWCNIGDSYNGSGGAGGDYLEGGLKAGQPKYSGRDYNGLKHKDLVGIPWRLAFALQADGWYLRSDIIWNKPNPMPESVTDRPTKSHEYLFLLAKQERYYYDAEAIKEDSNCDKRGGFIGDRYIKKSVDKSRNDHGSFDDEISQSRNRRSVWTIPTAPYKGAHFATFPPALVEPCIKAGTSERGVCPKCGKGWRRIINHTGINRERNLKINTTKSLVGVNEIHRLNGKDYIHATESTNDWQSSCTCDAGEPIPCLVFDPFVGSGTTVKVAYDLGRRGVGLDLSLEYLDNQARTRIHNGHVGRLI